MEPTMSSPLFRNMAGEEIEGCLVCSGTQQKQYKKGSMIFKQMDTPACVYLMLEGAVSICKDSPSGRQTVLTTIDRPGDLFGEVYLFLNQPAYHFYALAIKATTVLEIPKDYFFQSCTNRCEYHYRLIENMLTILANKAYLLSQKVQFLSAGSLRQRIASYLLEESKGKPLVILPMNREEFASYLNVARPSLSRELQKMQEDGVIAIKGSEIRIHSFNALEEYL